MKKRLGRLWSLRRRVGSRSSTEPGARDENTDTTMSSESVTVAPPVSTRINTTHPLEDRTISENPLFEFDRELEQHQIVENMLTERIRTLQARMVECRDGGELSVDYQRYHSQVRRLEEQLAGLADSRRRYVADRDRLAAWGPTDDWVVAGSIVTIQYLDGHRDTFVLTERPLDTEYETVSYESPIGSAVKRRKVGDKVSLPAGAQLTIVEITAGFRVDPHIDRTQLNQSEVPGGGVQRMATQPVPTASEADQLIGGQRCSDKTYRDDLYRRRTAPNVRRINEYVDLLRSQRPGAFIPYIAPTYGGVHARLLTLMQDPGPKTDSANHNGSGMICLENADLTAARQKYFLTQAGIDVSQIVSWNAYPWPKPHPQTENTDRAAAVALRGFLELTPQLEAVILNGVVAKRVWAVMKRLDPHIAMAIREFPTFHTSPRAVDPAKRSAEYIEDVNRDLSAKYIAAGRKLNGA
ncbi:GreA/GreB family elongation factor [Rhodococcus sp. 2H158]